MCTGHSKWGAHCYFKHYQTAAFLLENGMNPNHKNWREFTLLHDMAHVGEVEKSRLLIDHGADLDQLGRAAAAGSTPMTNIDQRHWDRPRAGAGKTARPCCWNVALIRTNQELKVNPTGLDQKERSHRT
jgi:ankyrin repeat protein